MAINKLSLFLPCMYQYGYWDLFLIESVASSKFVDFALNYLIG